MKTKYLSESFITPKEFFTALSSLGDLIDIDDESTLNDLGLFFDDASSQWCDDSEKEIETILWCDLHLKTGKLRMNWSNWCFGISGCGEIHMGSRDHYERVISNIIREKIKSSALKCCKENYEYDGSNWFKPTNNEDSE